MEGYTVHGGWSIMADTIRVAVLYGFGINCDHETKAVFEMAGAEAVSYTHLTLPTNREE